MQSFMNKKNLNRIDRKTVALIHSRRNYTNPHSTISTFRSISHDKYMTILDPSEKFDNPKEDALTVLSIQKRFSIHKKFDELAQPKRKVKSFCLKPTQIPTLNHMRQSQPITAKGNPRVSLSRVSKNSLNQTISFFESPKKVNPKLFRNSELDLQHEDFTRRQVALSTQEKINSKKQSIPQNTILSNNLGQLSTGEILEIKRDREQKRDLFLGLIKTGQQISNEAMESEELRELCNFVPDSERKTHPHIIQSETVRENPLLDKKVKEKYHNLVQQINSIDKKYQIAPYEDYDKTLSQKWMSHRRKVQNKNSKITLYCAEEWR